MKILIVEDERLLADSLKTMLEKKGFSVETVYDGENGAEYARTGIYDLLIQSQKQILSKEVILARVWGYDSNAVENHVEVYVGFLRKKLKSIGSNIRITAVRRLGYRLEVEEA